MSTDKISLWIQIGTGLAVIAGLGLVVWELQQVRTLTRAQLTSELFAISASLNASISGENPAAALAKACTSPESLTREEAIVVDAFYDSQLQLAGRAMILTDRDGIYPEGYWQSNSGGYFASIVESAYGRAWLLRQQIEWWPEGLIEYARGWLAAQGHPWCHHVHEDILQGRQEYQNNLQPLPEFEPPFIQEFKSRMRAHAEHLNNLE